MLRGMLIALATALIGLGASAGEDAGGAAGLTDDEERAISPHLGALSQPPASLVIDCSSFGLAVSADAEVRALLARPPRDPRPCAWTPLRQRHPEAPPALVPHERGR